MVKKIITNRLTAYITAFVMLVIVVGCSQKKGQDFLKKYQSLKIPDILEEVMDTEKPKSVDLIGIVYNTFPSQNAIHFTDINTAVKYACCADCAQKAPKVTVRFADKNMKLPAKMALIKLSGEISMTENNDFIMSNNTGFKFLENIKSFKQLQM